jgi:ribosomal protein L32
MIREIEEMAKIMCQDAGTKNCNISCNAKPICDVHFYAERLYKEGYRKKEIGVLEIGATTKDLAHEEGLPPNATKKERAAYHDFMSHIAHCSSCGGMHDDRTIEVGHFCKYCGAYMGGKINDKRETDWGFRDWRK